MPSEGPREPTSTPHGLPVECFRPTGDWSFALPFTLRVRPTWHGLEVLNRRGVPQEEIGRIFPWNSLAPLAGRFMVRGPDGGVLHRDRRLVLLEATPARRSRVAHRMHTRALRRAVRSGLLDVCIEFESQAAARRFVLSLAVVLCGLLLYTSWGWLVASIGMIAGGDVLLGLFSLLLGLAYAAGFPAVVVLVAWRLTDQNVRRVRIRAEGIEAEFTDGRVVKQRWSDLRAWKDATGSTRLEFLDGTRLRVPSRYGAHAVLRELQRSRDPGARDREKREHRGIAIRSFVYCQIGGIVAAWAIASGFVPAGLSALMAYLFIGFGLPALMVLSMTQAWLFKGAS